VDDLGNTYHGVNGTWADGTNYLHYRDATLFWITFTPDPTYVVTLESFVIEASAAVFLSGGPDFTWRVRQDSTAGAILNSNTHTNLPTVYTTATPNVTYAGTLVLEMQFAQTSNIGFLAVDDISFFQVPEPASALLLAAGGTLVLRRKRA